MRLTLMVSACCFVATAVLNPEQIAPDVKEVKLTSGDDFSITVSIVREGRRAIARCGVHGFYYGTFVERDGRPRYEQQWFRDHAQLSHLSSRMILSDKRGVYSIVCFAPFARRRAQLGDGVNGSLQTL
mgnify:CR=1 FL=1